MRMRDWQLERKTSPGASAAVNADLAAMQLDDTFGDREPETRPRRLAAFFAAIEALEDKMQIFFRDATAIVHNFGANLAVRRQNFDGHRARRVVQRVLDQVFQWSSMRPISANTYGTPAAASLLSATSFFSAESSNFCTTSRTIGSRFADFGDDFFGFVVTADIVHDNRGAGLSQAFRDRFADSGIRSSHDRALPIESRFANARLMQPRFARRAV